MFNIKLGKKSNKINFKALPVKMERSKNRQWGTLWETYKQGVGGTYKQWNIKNIKFIE